MKKTRLLTFALFLFTKLLFAQTPYIGEVRLFAGNFAPYDWAFCDGSLLPISQYEVLFTLLGTTYGGDGVDTFALPDLRGRVPVGSGQGPSLTNRIIGEMGGQESVTITTANMPTHVHSATLLVNDGNATTSIPTATSSIATSGIFSGREFIPNLSYNTTAPDVVMQTVTTSSVGNGIPIDIIAPRLGLNYIIALNGIYPSPQ